MTLSPSSTRLILPPPASLYRYLLIRQCMIPRGLHILDFVGGKKHIGVFSSMMISLAVSACICISSELHSHFLLRLDDTLEENTRAARLERRDAPDTAMIAMRYYRYSMLPTYPCNSPPKYASNPKTVYTPISAWQTSALASRSSLCVHLRSLPSRSPW